MSSLHWFMDFLFAVMAPFLFSFSYSLFRARRSETSSRKVDHRSHPRRNSSLASLFPKMKRRVPQASGRDVWQCAEWIDSACTALQAGLSLFQAYRISTSLLSPSPVQRDFSLVEESFYLGSSFSESFNEAMRNARTEPVKRVLEALQRSQKLGSQASDVLCDIREVLQTELSTLHHERVARLPVQMLFPLAVFVLPALLLLVCAPLVGEFAALLFGSS